MHLVKMNFDSWSLYNCLRLAFKSRGIGSDVLIEDREIKDSLSEVYVNLDFIADMFGITILVKDEDQEPTDEELSQKNTICLHKEIRLDRYFYSLYALNQEEYDKILALADKGMTALKPKQLFSEIIPQEPREKIYKIQFVKEAPLPQHHMLRALYIGMLLNGKRHDLGYAELAMECLADPAPYIASKYKFNIVVIKNSYQPSVQDFRLKNCIMVEVSNTDSSCGLYITESQLRKIINATGGMSFERLLHEHDRMEYFECTGYFEFKFGSVDATAYGLHFIEYPDCDKREGNVDRSQVEAYLHIDIIKSQCEEEQMRRSIELSLQEKAEEANKLDGELEETKSIAAGGAAGMATDGLTSSSARVVRFAPNTRYDSSFSAPRDLSAATKPRSRKIVDLTAEYREHLELMSARGAAFGGDVAPFDMDIDTLDEDNDKDLQMVMLLSLKHVPSTLVDKTDQDRSVSSDNGEVSTHWRGVVDSSRDETKSQERGL